MPAHFHQLIFLLTVKANVGDHRSTEVNSVLPQLPHPTVRRLLPASTSCPHASPNPFNALTYTPTDGDLLLAWVKLLIFCFPGGTPLRELFEWLDRGIQNLGGQREGKIKEVTNRFKQEFQQKLITSLHLFANLSLFAGLMELYETVVVLESNISHFEHSKEQLVEIWFVKSLDELHKLECKHDPVPKVYHKRRANFYGFCRYTYPSEDTVAERVRKLREFLKVQQIHNPDPTSNRQASCFLR